ncbi:hypothetical protein THMIRHAS_14530 [Thiosulfatimonas sediminis]|uniref:Sialidase domain-containing protein n=1 Tax=Thiosulfatimonas sediminis TaxID=2675054 RepID=A0A6F8PVT2_9GAMM|nr:sialidase family protein [Thiosulfatimonas sediminis]BBP46080.1 hypothetical protein THMIRHAS_14530 [Thiosulfatimonas sediminis]
MPINSLTEYPDIQLDFRAAPKTEAPVYLAQGVTPLAQAHQGAFIRNAQNQLLYVSDQHAYLSSDEGETWQAFSLFTQAQKLAVTNSHSLLCTHSGVVLLSFVNTGDYHFNWRKKTNKPTKSCRLFHYVLRSLDGGKTWQEPILIQTGYAAVASTLIQLKSGTIVLSAQNLDYLAARHYSLSFRSLDEGVNWQASNKLDIGGRGHHGGCYEGALIELRDCVWFCIRTNLDYFWHAYSYDDGQTWTKLAPGIAASSSPAMLTRLQSGRIMLLYNTVYPQGKTEFARRGGQFSEVAASWQREELAASFSEDDGLSWSAPVVLAQCKGAWLAYPYAFEVSAGKIWVTTLQSKLRILVDEQVILKSLLQTD